MWYYHKEPVTLNAKFEVLKERYLLYLMKEHGIDFDFKNLRWIKKNIKKYLPCEFRNFDLLPTFDLLSKNNEKRSLTFWEGKKLTLSWKTSLHSILLNIDLFTKKGFYSEMDNSTFECIEISDVDMDSKNGWDQIIELLKKYMF